MNLHVSIKMGLFYNFPSIAPAEMCVCDHSKIYITIKSQ